MDRVTTLQETLHQEMSAYAGEWTDIAGNPFMVYFAENQIDQVYCVLAPYDPAFKKAELLIMARIVNDQIIIDHDKTDKPLRDALLQAGVPAEQIKFAWELPQ